MQGALPLGSKSSDLVPAPQCGRSAPRPGLPLHDARGAAPREQVVRLGSYSPTCRRSALHPGDFPDAGKVTKGAPRAAPFGIPRCVVAALFALAPHCSGSRRATFSHRKRPICHFELVDKPVLFFPLVPSREHFQLSIRGTAGWVSRMLKALSYHNQYR